MQKYGKSPEGFFSGLHSFLFGKYSFLVLLPVYPCLHVKHFFNGVISPIVLAYIILQRLAVGIFLESEMSWLQGRITGGQFLDYLIKAWNE